MARRRQIPPTGLKENLEKLVAELILFVTKQDGINLNELIFPVFSHD